MTIFKEADLKDLPKTKKSKVKDLLSRGHDIARKAVSPKFIAAELAKKHPVGRIWKKLPKKSKQKIVDLLSRGYKVAKNVVKGKIKKQYGGSVRKAKY